MLRCGHTETTRCFTLETAKYGKRSYVVCVDCGAELEYDLERMEIKGRGRARRRATAAVAAGLAAMVGLVRWLCTL